MLISEHEIDAFREERLSPPALIDEVERSVAVLYRLGVGVGKSLAVDRLLSHPGTFSRFGLVVYAAPSWNIIRERAIVSGRMMSPASWKLLKPRPVDQCGSYAEQWEVLETRGCSAYGKGTLCSECQQGIPEAERCFWPTQFSKLDGVQLIFATEQQLVLNRMLVWMLRARTNAGRVLVILDEARLLDASFEICLAPSDLERFLEVITALQRPKGLSPATATAWRSGIELLLEGSVEEINDAQIKFPAALHRRAYLLQAEGIQTFGEDFRYIGYDLGLLPWNSGASLWKDSPGNIHFIARPYLNCHLLILSAHLSAAYAAHRLGRGSIASPCDGLEVRHSKTRILNLRNRIGADSYFKRNHKQILDLFAVLIARNISEGRTTLLVSRKKSKAFCATYLERRLKGWGVNVKFLTDSFEALPKAPDPMVIPIIHYGILGVNDYTEYESAYSLNSFYISSVELNRHVQDSEPERFRVRLKIVSGPELMRRVVIEEQGAVDLDHTTLGNIYLRKLEVDPAIQAAGRVRFLTRPREVIFFQMHNLVQDLGTCEELRTLKGLQEKLGLPPAKEIDSIVRGSQAQALMGEGLAAEDAAARIGVSRRTVFNDFRTLESAKNPTSIYIRRFCTLPPSPGREERPL